MTKPVQQRLAGLDRDGASRTSPTDTALADTTQLYALFSAMVRAAGGIDWLVAALDREPSYHSKISEAINRREGRYVQLDWLAPLLSDEKAGELLMAWLSERLGYEPPVKQREVTREQMAEAALEVARELGPLKDTFRDLVAKRLGVKPDRVKL